MRGLQALLARGRRTRRAKKRDPHWLAPPRHAPGTAAVSWFFDSYPRFYETSRTGAARSRLNLRYEAIFGENRDVFEGARVLDLASHDGRWSLAALKSGAAEVVGIEADEELHAGACENLSLYCDGIATDSSAAISSRCSAARDSRPKSSFVSRFLYYTIRYNELMARIREIGPRHLMIDTDVLRRRDRSSA
jgi:hypothetical protein